MDQLTQIFITVATVLTSAGAWQFYQDRLRVKTAKHKAQKYDENLYRDDLRDRVAQLEQKLEDAYRERDSVSEKLGAVMAELAEFRVRVEYLEQENKRLRNE